MATGLACSAIYTVSRGIEIGDVILTPDGNLGYKVGEVASAYWHAPGGPLPHRRSVHWRQEPVPIEAVSSALQASAGTQQTCISLSPHGTEIAQLIGTVDVPVPVDQDGTRIDDPVVFAMEKHLEAFLVANWDKTVLGKSYDIYQDDGDAVGQSQHEGDPVGTPSLRSPDAGDRLLLRRSERHPGAPGPAGPVRQPEQALTREPLSPVGVRRPRDASIGARIGHWCPRRDHVQQPCAPVRGQSGVRVIVLRPNASLAGVALTSTV